MKLSYLFQTWKCVDVIPAPTIDECCGIKTNCTIYRTHKKLPYLLTASWGPIIRRVTSLDGYTEMVPITPLDWNRKTEDTNRKYDKSIYYFWSDGYLYFPNMEWKGVKIEAYFEEDIDKYNDCDNKTDPCKTMLDNKFRIPKEVLAVCIDNVNKEVIGQYNQIPDDNQIDKNPTRKN